MSEKIVLELMNPKVTMQRYPAEVKISGNEISFPDLTGFRRTFVYLGESPNGSLFVGNYIRPERKR